MIQQIMQKVIVECKYLDSNIETHIFNKLKKTMEGICTFNTGYIIEVKKIIALGSNTIGNSNSLVIFNVSYQAEVLKPCEGQILTGKVCMIFQHGIFVDVFNRMKVLIPVTSMQDYTYNQSDSTFESETKSRITLDKELSIEIVMIKYEKKQFSCIGKIIS